MTAHPPRAFSGSRLVWADLPRGVRRRIGELAGAAVVSETSATSGFSPGYAAVLELGDGTEVFVKAVSPNQNPESVELARREIEVAALLPATVRAPRLLWHHDDDTWVLTGWTAVHGRSPATPWRADELALVLDAVTEFGAAGSPSPAGLRALAEDVRGDAAAWGTLAADGVAVDRARVALGERGDWMTAHLDDLQTWSTGAPEAAAGESLVHGDLRGDNVMIETGGPGQVWLIDWPWAAGQGARWYDLLSMLPSVAMQGGPDPDEVFWSHPCALGADRDAVRAVLVGLAGHFVLGSVQAPPPGVGNLRGFQRAQGVAALDWLARL